MASHDMVKLPCMFVWRTASSPEGGDQVVLELALPPEPLHLLRGNIGNKA
jgi:hypothetical protein